MAVNPTGQDELPGGVQLLLCTIERIAERDDAAVADTDVRREAVGRGHHGAPSDDEIESAHVCNLPQMVPLR